MPHGEERRHCAWLPDTHMRRRTLQHRNRRYFDCDQRSVAPGTIAAKLQEYLMRRLVSSLAALFCLALGGHALADAGPVGLAQQPPLMKDVDALPRLLS